MYVYMYLLYQLEHSIGKYTMKCSTLKKQDYVNQMQNSIWLLHTLISHYWTHSNRGESLGYKISFIPILKRPQKFNNYFGKVTVVVQGTLPLHIWSCQHTEMCVVVVVFFQEQIQTHIMWLIYKYHNDHNGNILIYLKNSTATRTKLFPLLWPVQYPTMSRHLRSEIRMLLLKWGNQTREVT